MVDQIVEFLHANIPSDGPSRNPDPFTGGVPENTGRSAGGARRGPVAEEISYNPSPWADNEPSAPKRSKPASAAGPAASGPKAFPLRSFVLFDAVGNMDGLIKKAVEFGANPNVIAALAQKLARPTQAALTDADMATLTSMLQWPANRVFLALDLARLFALSESGNAIFTVFTWKQILQVGLSETSPAPCPMLALRFLVNCVRWDGTLKGLLVSELSAVLDAAADTVRSEDAKVHNALCLFLQNVAVILSSKPGSLELKTQAIGLIGELLEKKLAPNDLFTLVAVLGTLVWEDREAKALVVDLELTAKIEAARNATDNANVKGACAELLAYCKQ